MISYKPSAITLQLRLLLLNDKPVSVRDQACDPLLIRIAFPAEIRSNVSAHWRRSVTGPLQSWLPRTSPLVASTFAASDASSITISPTRRRITSIGSGEPEERVNEAKLSPFSREVEKTRGKRRGSSRSCTKRGNRRRQRLVSSRRFLHHSSIVFSYFLSLPSPSPHPLALS